MKPLQYVFYQENVLPIPGPTHDIMNKSEAILSTIITDNRSRKMEITSDEKTHSTHKRLENFSAPH